MKVVLTGGCGRVAKFVRPGLLARYGWLRLSDGKPMRGKLAPGEEFVRASLVTRRGLTEALAGVDAVVHAGGVAYEASWDKLRTINVDGTFNVLEEAARAGVRRFVYLSSGHVTGYYRADEMVSPTDPVRPDSLYAVSKVACEAMCAFFAHRYGMSVVAIRVGKVAARPSMGIHRAIWIAPEDLTRLIWLAMEQSPGLPPYQVLYGVSDNPEAFWSYGPAARRLGYCPAHSAASFRDGLPSLDRDGYQGQDQWRDQARDVPAE